MQRLVAFLLAQALVLSPAMAAPLHVHEYVGHDHPSHHHGPAAHQHEHSAEPDPNDHHATDIDHMPAVQADACDAGRHAVSVTVGCAPVPRTHIDLAELPGPTVVNPVASTPAAKPLTDVRVHGPPCEARIPSRAPPLIHLA